MHNDLLICSRFYHLCISVFRLWAPVTTSVNAHEPSGCISSWRHVGSSWVVVPVLGQCGAHSMWRGVADSQTWVGGGDNVAFLFRHRLPCWADKQENLLLMLRFFLYVRLSLYLSKNSLQWIFHCAGVGVMVWIRKRRTEVKCFC